MHAHLNGHTCPKPALPDWVPDPVKTYLAHLEGGNSFRHIARKRGCHASTIMRQVRRTEGLRDDPLADAALSTLETFWRTGGSGCAGRKGTHMSLAGTERERKKLDRDIQRALKALTEPRALLVIAEGVEDAVIVANEEGDRPVRRAVIPREVAEIMALKEWIEGRMKGRLGRYAITAAGRAELGRLLARTESQRAQGRGEADERIDGSIPKGRLSRSAGTEAPLRVLARRKRGNGQAFLAAPLVQAAERFRESFEIARVSGALGDDLAALMEGRVKAPVRQEGATALAVSRGELALGHLVDAVRAIGPELAETVVMAVCEEWGMEKIEKEYEFPARSGKIVLRIALHALARHYEKVGSQDHDLIF
ncbi:DUF6456 domain-containing protein [Maritimibacter dapengensis]|uniref:Helix-turn-helix domain-containing protein n=1 Tax=Maritimibacter dapengensis TaxID=2836868 RepID=A0ABS6T2U9_9RHOB|nr:DUF6456 domain-containing protein [Maritimibacter dapengensis]MBV7379454.1 helix-turn-helix domain-containing protein [Maritimibacter dapengensis]